MIMRTIPAGLVSACLRWAQQDGLAEEPTAGLDCVCIESSDGCHVRLAFSTSTDRLATPLVQPIAIHPGATSADPAADRPPT
jgi:hypothetical protein